MRNLVTLVPTPEALAHSVAERWKRQYCVGGEWRSYPKVDSEATYQAMIALGPWPSPGDIARIIGNDSWTRPNNGTCLGCGAPGFMFLGAETPDTWTDDPQFAVCRRCAAYLIADMKEHL